MTAPARAGAPRRDCDGADVPTSRPSTGSSRSAQILCDFRPDAGLRLGPHYFTTDDELRFAVEQIVEIVETGAARPAGAAAY